MSKVLLDFSQIQNTPTGVGNYAYNLLLNIINDESLEYGILVQSDSFIINNHILKKIKIHKVPSFIFRNFIMRFFLEQVFLPIIAIINGYRLIHSFHYSFPILTLSKRIVTICDMTFFLHPDYHQKVKIFYFRFFIYLSKWIPESLIFISKSTENDYKGIIGNPKRYSTIPLAVSVDYNSKVKKKLSLKTREKYNIYDEYILYIGTIEPRKNLLNLVKSFELIYKDNKNINLVIVGKDGWFFKDFYDAIGNFYSLGNIIFTGYVQEDEKIELLGGAKCFVYVSFYEGFGLPVLESISCGIPTVSSNISSLPEVVSSSALLVDPNDINQIYAAISLIINSTKVSLALSRLGIDRSRFFSWTKTATSTIVAYKDVLDI